MHQFWNTVHKIKDTDAYRFKLDKKKFRVDTKVFHEILQIFPRLLNQDFIEPPSEEKLVTFIQELGYSGKCISGKTTGFDRLRESRAQILWGMYNKKNVDYVSLIWEDFMYQADNREISSARKEHMPYLRFMKVIISHFISKDKTISMRNKINLNIICDDILLDSKAYKTYLDFATRKATPKKERKFKKVASPSRKLSPVLEEEHVKKPKRAKKPAKKSTTVPTTGVVISDTPNESMPKKKTPAKINRGKSIDLLSEVSLLKDAHLKKTLKKSKLETHKLHASGSDDGFGSLPKVPDEQEDKTTGTDEGTGTIPRVPDIPKYPSESENESWGESDDDDENDDDSDEVTKDDDDDDDVDSDADGEMLNQNDDEEEENEEEYVCTPNSFNWRAACSANPESNWMV
ncbi:hypothetical protein Tco_0162158 [Tanacetum coccineum]